MGQSSLQVTLVGIGVEGKITHESVDGGGADGVDVHFLADLHLLDFDVLEALLLFQLGFELCELFLGHVLLLEHLEVSCFRGTG